MFSVNWLTWETKSYGIPKKLGTEGRLGGIILESVLELRLENAQIHSLPRCQPFFNTNLAPLEKRRPSLFMERLEVCWRKACCFIFWNPGIPATCLFRAACPNFAPGLPLAMLSKLTFYCYDKHHKQKQLRGKRGLFVLFVEPTL